MKKLLCFSTISALLFLSSIGASGGQTDPKEEKAIKQRAEQFTAAFDKGDAKALASFWTTDGDYVDLSGKHLQGRKAIEESFAKMFEEAKGAKLHIHMTSLRVVSPDLAIEDGTAEVTPPGGGPGMASTYMIVHVKKDGEWHLASVRDSEAKAPSNFNKLSDLGWLIGTWVDEGSQGAAVTASYEFTDNQNFIISNLTASIKDVPISGRTQWIGWDPAAKHIRSWSFNSDGSFGEAVWTVDGKKVTIKVEGTRADGKKTTATNFITRTDDDHATAQVTKLMLDGKPMPDIEPIKMKRVKQ